MKYEINMQTLNTDIQGMRDVVAKLRSEMNLMFEDIQVLDTMWDGPANEAFKQQFILDKDAFEVLCTSVDEMIDSMADASKTYSTGEAQVGYLVDTIRI